MNFPKFSGLFFCRTSANGHLWMFSISWILRKENILKVTAVNQQPTTTADELFECVWPFCRVGAWSVKLKFYLKSSHHYVVYFFKKIRNKASLIFAFTVSLSNSLHTSKINFIMFNNVSHKSPENARRINCK